MKPEEKERPVAANVQARSQHQRNVEELAALQSLRGTWSTVPRGIPIGVSSDAFSAAANVRLLGECPMCGSAIAEMALVDLASGRRDDSAIGSLYAHAEGAYDDRYFAEFLPAPEYDMGVSIVGVYHGGDYGENVVYVDEGVYAGDMSYSTV